MPDVDNGWFLFTEAYFLIAAGDYDQAAQLLARAADMGSRRRETDLIAFATTVWGRALIKAGRLEEVLAGWTRRCCRWWSATRHRVPRA